MSELLLEILSEEIPARMQARASENLKHLVCDGLKERGLSFTGARAFATPRRLALVVEGIPQETEQQIIERRGPRIGAPQSAISGFLKATGLASIEDAEKRDTGKGEFWFAVQRVAGAPALSSVIGAIDDALDAMTWPKSMRWADYRATWVRPIHSILAQLDGAEIPVRFHYERSESALSDPKKYLEAGNATRGHRFLPNGNLPPNSEITVSGFADYIAKLEAAHVIVDPKKRLDIIHDRSAALCARENVSIVIDPTLESEVAGLVEWPVPLVGTIDAEFMDLPPEVLIVSMRTHQRYFATHDRDGKLANRFIVVANNVASDDGQTIVAGNERVLRARLSDAKFFWDQDRKVRLADRLDALRDVVFHAKLGTQYVRVALLTDVAVDIGKHLMGLDRSLVAKAASLCKADLTSGMVGEFPELQGVMGRYYALEEGLRPEIADAIRDHYLPQGPKDQCPSKPTSIAVALADKALLLAQFWAIDEKPTGSGDPFALRRAALGLVRIIVEGSIHIPLRWLLGRTVDRVLTELYYAGKLATLDEIEKLKSRGVPSSQVDELVSQFTGAVKAVGYDDDDSEYSGITQLPEYREIGLQLVESLLSFILERFKIQMREKGVRHDIVDAVFALGGEDDLVRLLARVQALQSFLDSEAGRNLLAAYGRAANIVRVEERKDRSLAQSITDAPDRSGFEQDEEIDLYLKLDALPLSERIQREDFVGAMSDLADLRPFIDSFFEKVTVNVAEKPDLRLNRLKLLNQIRATMDSVADFSRIEG